MNSATNFAQSALSGSNEILLVLVVFTAVFLGIIGTMSFFTRGSVDRRLSGRADEGQARAAPRGPVSIRYDTGRSFVDRVLRPVQKYVEPKNEERISQVRRNLMQAGYMTPAAPGRYFAIRVVLAIGLPLVVLMATPALSRELSVPAVVLMVAGAGLFGLYAPTMFVLNRKQKRQQSARLAFPDVLDMLIVCVEAGLGLNAAIQRVGTEMERAHPMLSEQLKLVGLELRAGKSREVALRNLSERIGIEEVRSLITVLIQSEELGTSIAQALDVYANDMRTKRMLRAEEKAQKLPVKLAFPLVCFILPCLMLVIMTPAIIKIIRVLAPSMGGN